MRYTLSDAGVIFSKTTHQRDGSFGLPLACAQTKGTVLLVRFWHVQTKSYYVCSGNVVWGWGWR